QRALGGRIAQLRWGRPGTAQRGGIWRTAIPARCAQQRVIEGALGHLACRRVHLAHEHVAHGLQGLALHAVPAPAGSAPAALRRRSSHHTGPDSAYSAEAASSVLGGSIHSAISTPTAISSAKNGTRSERGPLPRPLKLE